MILHLTITLPFTPVLAAGEAPVVVQQTLLQKLNMPTIYILLACSMLIVWLVIDGYLKTTPRQLVPEEPKSRLASLLASGDWTTAYHFGTEQPNPLTQVVRTGLRFAPAGRSASEDAMASAIAGENARFQSRIAYLSVIGVIAPMIGLAGTVFGMISAFDAMGQAGAADPSKLSAAIGAVLYATAGGLCVAIPAFVFYYLLRDRTARAIHQLHEAAADLFRLVRFDELADVEFERNGGVSVAESLSTESIQERNH